MLFLGSVPRSVERAVSCPTLPSGSVVTIEKEENCTHAITAPQMCNIHMLLAKLISILFSPLARRRKKSNTLVNELISLDSKQPVKDRTLKQYAQPQSLFVN